MDASQIKKLVENVAQVHPDMLIVDDLPAKLMRLLVVIMECVEGISAGTLEGSEKKDAVLQVLRDLFKDTQSPVVDVLVNQVAPYAIDVLCAVAKGDFIIQTAKTCCHSCLPF